MQHMTEGERIVRKGRKKDDRKAEAGSWGVAEWGIHLLAFPTSSKAGVELEARLIWTRVVNAHVRRCRREPSSPGSMDRPRG